jgi:type II secretory pathway component PulF
MPLFQYTARTAAGQNVDGSLTAGSERELLRALAEKALFPLTFKAVSERAARPMFRKKIKMQAVATNLSQLADLLQNGVPLLRSLEILAAQATQKDLADILTDIRDRVAEGESLDSAMDRHREVFGELTVSLVRAGSEGAFLEESLKRTADFLELQEELKWRVVGALTYPAVLAVAGFLAAVIIMVFIVPQFASLFERLEESGGLPAVTVALLWVSDTLGRYGLVILAAAVGGVWWFRRWARTEKGRFAVDRVKLKIPVLGPIVLDSAVSRFCRVLGTLLRNGVPLLRAMEISSDSAGNKLLSRAILASAENVQSGDTLSRPLAECGLVPKNAMAMIAVAEESNTLDTVLVSIADVLDRQIARKLDIMVRLLEPALLLVMGSVFLFMIVGLLLPVFDMTSQAG